MKYRDILLPIVTAAAGFAAGWYLHQKKTATLTADALKQQADMYKAKLKEADDLFQSVTYQKAMEKLDELKQKEAKEDVEKWRSTLSPGFYTYDEYSKLFGADSADKVVASQNDISGKENTVGKPIMSPNGDPLDDVIEENDGEFPYLEEDDCDDYMYPHEINYISENELGDVDSYQMVYLRKFTDGLVSDDAYNIVPAQEVGDLIGDDYDDHFGEFGEEALWVANKRTKTYYEVMQDPRTYREAVRG